MQDVGQPPVGPSGDPLDAPFFEDPFEAMASAFDNPTGSFFGCDIGFPSPKPDNNMDDLPRERSVFEKSFDGTALPPSELEEPPLSPEPSQPIMQGYVSEGPPLPPEPTDHQWISLKPPLAARPYFAPDGIATPSYRPSGRAGSGMKSGSSSQNDEVYCPAEDDWVSQQNCEDCKYYDPDAEICKYHCHEEES